MSQKVYSPISILKVLKNFEKMYEKYSINLIDVESGRKFIYFYSDMPQELSPHLMFNIVVPLFDPT